jgi:hypothetical protein
MAWRGLGALAWMAGALAAGGCMGDKAFRAATVPPGPPQDGAGAVSLSSAGVARSQKPETPGRPVVLAAGSVEDRKGRPAISIRATVNGEAILDEEVQAAVGQSLAMARSPAEQQEIYKQALEHLIDREVLLQEALGRLSKGPQGTKVVDKLREQASKEFEETYLRRVLKETHMGSEAELKAYLREHDMSLEMIRRQWERQFLALQYLYYRVGPYQARVGHAELLDYYDKHPEDFQVREGVEWQDLFVDAAEHPSRQAARAFAESLAERARRDEDFATLARQYDRGDSKLREFKGVGRQRGEVRPPEAEPVLFRLKDGDAAVVEMRSGFHVVRLVHHELAHRRPFDDKVQKEIKEKLRAEVFARESKRIIADLRRKAVIERFSGQ